VTSLLVIFYYIRIIGILYVNDENKITNVINSGFPFLSEQFNKVQYINQNNFNIKISQIIGIGLISFWTIFMPLVISIINLIV